MYDYVIVNNDGVLLGVYSGKELFEDNTACCCVNKGNSNFWEHCTLKRLGVFKAKNKANKKYNNLYNNPVFEVK